MEALSHGKGKIMEAALQEFSEYGLAGARVDRIAAAAGVNKALLYYHFKSKDELYTATFEYLFDTMSPLLEPVSGSTIRERLLNIVAQFLTFLHHNRKFVRMMDLEALRSSERQPVSQQIRLWRVLMELYLSGVQTGELRPVENAEDFIVGLLGACHFFYSRQNMIAAFYGREVPESELLTMHIRAIQEMIARIFFLE